MVVRLAAPHEMPRATVREVVEVEGIGVHSGERGHLRIGPAPFGHGIAFVTRDGTVPVSPTHARPGAGRLRLERGRVVVDTPEHLLAAVSGLGLTDLRVVLEGPEVPILDGSARGWVDALESAGRLEGAPCIRRELPEVEVSDAGGRAWCGPGPDRLEVTIDYGHDGPHGRLALPRDRAGFLAVADARTFVLARDVARLVAAGRGRGASRANTVVWSPGDSADEPLRHKALDLWGDLAVLGPVAGTVGVDRGSHQLHQALVTAIAAAWATTGPRG